MTGKEESMPVGVGYGRPWMASQPLKGIYWGGGGGGGGGGWGGGGGCRTGTDINKQVMHTPKDLRVIACMFDIDMVTDFTNA